MKIYFNIAGSASTDALYLFPPYYIHEQIVLNLIRKENYKSHCLNGIIEFYD
jgi:hypothetical protein